MEKENVKESASEPSEPNLWPYLGLETFSIRGTHGVHHVQACAHVQPDSSNITLGEFNIESQNGHQIGGHVLGTIFQAPDSVLSPTEAPVSTTFRPKTVAHGLWDSNCDPASMNHPFFIVNTTVMSVDATSG